MLPNVARLCDSSCVNGNVRTGTCVESKATPSLALLSSVAATGIDNVVTFDSAVVEELSVGVEDSLI